MPVAEPTTRPAPPQLIDSTAGAAVSSEQWDLRHRSLQQIRLYIAAEQAEAKRLAEDEVQQVRLAATICMRDGNTLHKHSTFRRLSKGSLTPFDNRDIRVYYPDSDGSPCNVTTTSRGRSAARGRFAL